MMKIRKISNLVLASVIAVGSYIAPAKATLAKSDFSFGKTNVEGTASAFELDNEVLQLSLGRAFSEEGDNAANEPLYSLVFYIPKQLQSKGSYRVDLLNPTSLKKQVSQLKKARISAKNFCRPARPIQGLDFKLPSNDRIYASILVFNEKGSTDARSVINTIQAVRKIKFGKFNITSIDTSNPALITIDSDFDFSFRTTSQRTIRPNSDLSCQEEFKKTKSKFGKREGRSRLKGEINVSPIVDNEDPEPVDETEPPFKFPGDLELPPGIEFPEGFPFSFE